MKQPTKVHDGDYRASVVNVQDPSQLMRVQVRVFDFFDDVPDRDLPWASYQLPLGARPTDGGLIPVQVGDLVWVRFSGGDTRHPRIIGSCAHMPGGKPNLPPELWAGDGQFVHKRTPDEPVPETPVYHEDVAFKQHGVLIQITKTGALRATQLASGSALEIAVDGSLIAHAENSILASAPNRILLKVGGSSIDMKPDGIKIIAPRIDLNP